MSHLIRIVVYGLPDRDSVPAAPNGGFQLKTQRPDRLQGLH